MKRICIMLSILAAALTLAACVSGTATDYTAEPDTAQTAETTETDISTDAKQASSEDGAVTAEAASGHVILAGTYEPPEETEERAVNPADWRDDESGAGFSLGLPEGWSYSELSEEYRRGISVSSPDGSSFAFCYFPSRFGVCGTGLTEEKIELENGITAYVGYYDGGKTWSFVAFHGLDKSYAAVNEGLSADAAKEALDFILAAKF